MDLAGERDNPIWGKMRVERGLREVEEEAGECLGRVRRAAGGKEAASSGGGTEKGGEPTGTDGDGDGNGDEEASREYERERNRLIYSWVRGSTRKASVEMQEAVKQEFGLSGEVWHGTFKYALSQKRIDRLRLVVRKMYEETQADLVRKGVTEIRLYRGIRSPAATMRVISSWTASHDVARQSGERGILRLVVSADRVFMYHAGPGWQDGPFGQQFEYLVLGED